MRFIHLADVHLGAVPDRGCPWSSRREEEIWETFRRVIAGIRENPVDLLFIAGDLFHRQPLLRELKEVNNLFSTIPDTRVYLMAGNHDYIKADSFYRDFQWEKNVTFFKNEQLTCVKDEKLDVYVYGLSYEHQEIENPLYDSIHPAEGEGVHILLAHGGDAKHIPMNIKSIAASGFDYIALGHIHKPQILIRDNAAYAGALEPVDRNDLGDHGYIEGHLENGRLKTNFVPFACRSYEQILLMLREDSTQASLEDMLKAAQGAAAAAEKGISLTVQPCTGSARFDAKWTSEALFNVVDNALKYTPPGGRVTLSAECYELFCRIRVTDSGPGIPEEEQAQVFSRFYRGAAVREQDGLGLGLYLTRRILIRQGGYLRLFSRPGQGSEFSLYLPLE